MTVTLEKIVLAEKALKSLAEVKLPIKVSYRVGKLLQAVTPELLEFNKQRDKLIVELGEKDEKGANYTIQPNTPAMQEFATRLGELLPLKVEINADPISMTTLGEIDLTPGEMVALSPFLSED